MENENLNNPTVFEKITNIAKHNKKKIIIIFLFILIIISCFFAYTYYQQKKNEDISQKYIKAGIYLSSKDFERSKAVYKEIILSKNKFYSSLALNNLIENDLERNNEEILELFKVVEDIKMEKDLKDLVKLRKALYLIKITKLDEGKKLLEEIISSKSVWSGIASEAIK